MRVSLDWLSEWIELPEPDAVADRLTMGGLEVEAEEKSGPDLSAICVGEVVEHGAHPDADRLSVCRVSTGEGEPARVVCGAPNVAAGQKIAFARAGTDSPVARYHLRPRLGGSRKRGPAFDACVENAKR